MLARHYLFEIISVGGRSYHPNDNNPSSRAALTWDDIDFEKGVVFIRRSQVEGKVFPTKTSTNRSVPLFGTVAALLVEHKEWLQMQRFRRKDGLVVPSRTGTFRTSSMLRKPLRRCAKAGIDKVVTNQALQRTVNNLIRQTAGEIAARAITGHATQAMTEHYSDVTLDETQSNAGSNPRAEKWGARWGTTRITTVWPRSPLTGR